MAKSEHVLVWIRDRDRAARLCRTFYRSGLAAAWAASLPEAITLLDRLFPRAVACTLEGDSPSLIDLETLLAYLTIGHGTVSLPPIPIWALTPDPAEYAPHIENLQIPVYLVPAEMGIEGMAAEVVHRLSADAWHPAQLAAGPVQVLYVSRDARIGFYLSRYLTSRGLATLAVETVDEALGVLGGQPFHAVVADLRDEARGRRLLAALASCRPDLPVLGHGEVAGWLARLAPNGLPRNLVGVMAHPVKAQAVESSLRRLLRIPPPRRSRAADLHLAANSEFPPPPVG